MGRFLVKACLYGIFFILLQKRAVSPSDMFARSLTALNSETSFQPRPSPNAGAFFIFMLYPYTLLSLIYFSGSIGLEHIHTSLMRDTSENYPFVNTIIICPFRTCLLYNL